ncbi:recombinase family protein [Psychrobacillus sp. PGGUH221]|uniref:recombinase family protein n=1 Tax=Psychrobacillus sp. PGGUH221 TaxID=3020058 RepID=UPI0035C704D6
MHAGCKRIFTDVASGAKSSRTGLDEAIDFLREGDTLVVWKLDKLGRSLKHLIDLVNSLNEIFLVFQRISILLQVKESLFFMFLGKRKA